MKEKMYILHYPSNFGMGSNTDEMLLSDSDLRRIIRYEIEKRKRASDNNIERDSDRLTGTWNDEKFCDSADIKEIEEDVIAKRLSKCTTYAGVNDLIPIPEDVPIEATSTVMYDKIFHIFPDFDVIAGETLFTRYFIDLTQSDDIGRVEGGKWHEFLSFKTKRVLVNTYFDDIKYLLKSERDRCYQFKQRAEGTYVKPENKTYIADLIDIDVEKEYRISKPITTPNTYSEHFYPYYNDEWLENDIKKMRRKDYRKYAYQLPVCFNDIGIIESKEDILDFRDDIFINYYTYNDLFKQGLNVEYIPAMHVNSPVDSKEEFGEINAGVLMVVFGLMAM